MAGTIENFSDGEDVEDISDEEKMLREKNYLHYLDKDTVVKMGKTGVFWDAVGYPFPPGLSPGDIYQKIESALCDCYEGEDWDYMGEKSIWVYVDETKGPWGGDYLENKTWTSRIYFLPGGDVKHKRFNRMLNDIHLWTMDFPVIRPRPSSLVLVSDQVKDDLYSSRLLQNLSWIGFRVFLAAQLNEYRPENKDNLPASRLDVVYSFKEERYVSYCRPHKTKKQKPSSLSDVEDLPRVEDFSTIVQGGQLGVFWRSAGRKNNVFYCFERPVMVFWNVKQCPIPSDEVLNGIGNLRSALRNMGFHTPVKICAYGDAHLDDDQRDVFKKAGVRYAVEGERLRSSPIAKTRDYREMAVDLINFATPTYEHPAILVVISKPDKDSELHRVLKCLQSRNHHVLVVNPTVGDSGGGLFLGSIQGLGGEGEPITKPECWC